VETISRAQFGRPVHLLAVGGLVISCGSVSALLVEGTPMADQDEFFATVPAVRPKGRSSGPTLCKSR
jgi:hypothetical protein